MSWNGLDDFLTRVSDRLDPPRGKRSSPNMAIWSS